LPYPANSASRSVTVEKVAISLRVDKRWVEAGQPVKFFGVISKDGLPWVGARIWIRAWYDPNRAATVVQTTSGVNGGFSVEHRPPWEYATYRVPCRDIRFDAYQPDTLVVSNGVMVAVAYPTRISISAPSKVPAGYPLDVSGKLEYESAEGIWSGLAGKTVKVYYNGTLLGSATTGGDGSYRVRAPIPDAGTYTLKAVFEGEGIPTAAAFMLPPAIAELPIVDWVPLYTLITALSVYAPVATVGAVIAANEIAKVMR